MASDSANQDSPAPAGAQRAARRWIFGSAEFDEAGLALTVGGQSVHLEPKPLEVLLYLLRHAGEVVSKDELLEAVWPRRILSETTLANCISRLRDVLDDGKAEIIKTVYGYGYRLVAPVRIETQAAAPLPPSEISLKPGDSPPLRPNWSLVQRLGTGGRGDAWLARHTRTNEKRVFKFALDGSGLSSIKREITLFRALRQLLPDRGDFAQILDWNLEQPPFFTESEYVEGGSLLAWAERQGGLDRIPMETRLGLVADIADALAAAHSVGVLHKDLKPANVLVTDAPSGASVKLCDFGSGAMLDSGALEQLGITRLGFTQSVGATAETSGTVLYMPPEVLAGQPCTVQTDIYALGVMLYQVAVGSFARPLALGWESDIADELLREDIAAAATGRAERRLGDAGVLAQNLRRLPQRRLERAAQRQRDEQALRTRRAMERMKARRSWMMLASGSLAVGLVVSIAMTVRAQAARETAERATAAAREIQAFLTKDILLAGIGGPNQAPDYSTLLERAAARIDRTFAGRPLVAGELRYTVGRAFMNLGRPQMADQQLQLAEVLLEPIYGRGSAELDPVLITRAKLAYRQERYEDGLGMTAEIIAHRRTRLGPDHAQVLELEADQAWALIDSQSFEAAVAGLRKALSRAEAVGAPETLRASISRQLATALVWQSDFDEGIGLLEGLLTPVVGGIDAVLLSDISYDHGALIGKNVHVHLALAWAQAMAGNEERARREIQLMQEGIRQLGEDEGVAAMPLTIEGLIEYEAGNVGKGVALIERALHIYQANWGVWETDQILASVWLAQGYAAQGRLAEAAATARRALNSHLRVRGPAHPWTAKAQILLADIARRQGRLEESRRMLEQADTSRLGSGEAAHAWLGDYHRVRGLLMFAEGRREEARSHLVQAGRIYANRYGPQSVLVAAIRRDINLVSPPQKRRTG